ncbi:hypothetical protein F5J12DRAFT_786543 [Pisolithus orientalis]|uniref:uncharacterized protein n=1 Tax=Pisolithus orientalis TaxID=936130 RepID=UPI0022256403|nr:uncharacterized protein F5J12DRAFT_786543 [Pisolithus orientalis]KAI5990323.1 hypothetical protein F5J12DRAFT_786543 [Pisolithus orientalis]
MSIKLPNGEYAIHTLDGRPLAFPLIVHPDLGDIIIPPPPRPVYALPESFKPEPVEYRQFLVTLMEPERDLYQISALVNNNGGLVEWIVSPQRWILRPGQDGALVVQTEDLGSAWVAPPEGKYEQIRVENVPWNAQTNPVYPTQYLFRFNKL